MKITLMFALFRLITSAGHDDGTGNLTLMKGGTMKEAATISSLDVADGHTVSFASFSGDTVVTVERMTLGTGSKIANIGNYVHCNNMVLGAGAQITGQTQLVQGEMGGSNCLLNFTLASDAAVEAALAAGASSYTLAVSAQESTIWNVESLSNSNMSFTYGTLSNGGVVYQLDGKYDAAGSVAWNNLDQYLDAQEDAQEISLAAGASYVVIDQNRLISLTVTAPEPATAALSLLALVGVAARRIHRWSS